MIYKKIEVNEYIKNYELRILERKEIPLLIELFENVFNLKYSKDYWEWKFFKNPYGPVLSLSLWDKERIIGHYCADMKEFYIGDKEFKTANCTTAMTHSDYQRQGIFSFLAMNLYNKLAEIGRDFFYIFPNALYTYDIYIKKLRFKFLEKIKMYIQNLNEINEQKRKNCNYTFQKIKRYPKEFNDLKYNSQKGVYSKVTSEYLEYRYVNHPINKYDNFLIYDKKGNLNGFFVTKIYINDKGEKFGEIDDFKVLNDKTEVFEEIYHFLLEFYKNKNINYISLWTGEISRNYDIIIKNGFHVIELATSWSFQLLSDIKKKERQIISNFKNWDFRMGDSDVF